MTKHEKKLKSMLNYYEIDLKGKKSEKLSSKDLTRFIDKFNRNYDVNVISEIISKLKGEENHNPEDDDQVDYFLNNSDLEDDELNTDKNLDKPIENKNLNDLTKNNNDPVDSDINNFLKWLTLVLYSADHTVSIASSGKSIIIKLVKIDKGKK